MHIEIAKWMVAVAALYGFGGLIADAVVPSTSRQHLWNPAWPPHAKFHNAQTMRLGIFGGSLSLYLLFACGPLTLRLCLLAAAAAAMYWFSMALAPFFPGAAWYDPEFKDASRRPLGLSPQQLLSPTIPPRSCPRSSSRIGTAPRSTGPAHATATKT